MKQWLFIGALLVGTMLTAAEFLWQGSLTTLEGVPPVSRTQVLEFRLYTSETAATPVWGRAIVCLLSKDGVAVTAVSDEEGTPLEGVPGTGLAQLFANPEELYIGLTVQGSTELMPRQPIRHGSRAIVAKTATGTPEGEGFVVTGRLFATTATVGGTLTVAKDLNASGDAQITGKLAVGKAVNAGTIAGFGVCPIGAIVAVYAQGNRVPSMPDGWVICDGGNGTPDLRERFIVGADSRNAKYVLNKTGGAASVALTDAQIPKHTHSFTQYHTERYDGWPDAGDDSSSNDNRGYWRRARRNDWIVTSLTGSGAAHENRPSYHALYYFMRQK